MVEYGRQVDKRASRKRSLCCVAIFALLSLVAPRNSRASAGETLFYVGLGVALAADLTFLIHDLSTLGSPPNKAWAIAEVVLTIPQIALGAVLVAVQFSEEGGGAGPALAIGALTLLPTALCIHGIWALTRPSSASPLPPPPGQMAALPDVRTNRILLAPTVIKVRDRTALGVALALQF